MSESSSGTVAEGPVSRGAALYGLLSQLANSAGNVLLTFFVARHATQDGYGAWALGYAVYMMALAGARALTGTPILIGRFQSPARLRQEAAGANSLAFLLGTLASAGLLISGGAIPSLGAMFWPFAIVVPILLAQDAGRHFAFKRGKPLEAAWMDISWLTIQIVAFGLLEVTNTATAGWITLTWGSSALVGIVWISVRHGLLPRVAALRAFWASARVHGMKLFGEAALGAVVAQALPMVVALAAGLAAAGALRGGLTLIGLINILVAGLTPVATLAARHEFETKGTTRQFLIRWTILLAATSSAFGLAVLLIPDSLGRQLLGDSWLGASALLVPLVLQSIVRGPYTGVPVVLRATDRVGSALRLRAITTIPSLLFPWAGAILDGASGAAWGIFASAMAASALALTVQRASTRPTGCV